MKKLFFIFLFLVACSDYPDIVRVCVNYLEPETYCGTGFFIYPDELITAYHIIDKAEDNILTAIGPGINETAWDLRYFANTDIGLAVFENSVTMNLCRVCENVKIGTKVEMLGVTSSVFRTPKSIKGTITDIFENKLVIDRPNKPGFSGGPVIDIEQKCIVGVMSYVEPETQETVAYNLTTLDI